MDPRTHETSPFVTVEFSSGRSHEPFRVNVRESTLYADKMNIFVLSEHPQECAVWMCDYHIIRAAKEYPDILTNVHSRWGAEWNRGRWPQCQYTEHPNVLWAGDTLCNYQWLVELTKSVWQEFRLRFQGRTDDRFDHITHRNEQHSQRICWPPRGMPSGNTTMATPPPQCLPEDYQIHQSLGRENRWHNTVRAYRDYYIQEKYRFAKWTKVRIPEWFEQGNLELSLDAQTTHETVEPDRKRFQVIADDTE